MHPEVDHQSPVGVKVVLESLEMIVAHRGNPQRLFLLLTRLVGSDCSYIGSWKKGGLQVEEDRIQVLLDMPFFVAVTSYFVVGIPHLDLGILQAGN